MIVKHLRLLVTILIFLYPVLCNLVKHAGSTVLLFLTLCGIAAWFSKQQPVKITRAEKWIMLSFAVYFGVILIFFLGHGLFNEAIPLDWEHDNDSRMLAFIPIFFAFLFFKPKIGAIWYGLSIGAIASGVHSVLYVYIFREAHRATGGYHAIAFGDLSLLFGFMSMTGIAYFRNKHPLLMIIPILALVGGIVATILSATKGAIIAIPALILILLVQVAAHPKAWLLRSMIAAVLVMTAGAYFLLGTHMDRRIKATINQTYAFFEGNTGAKKDLRLQMWSEAIKIIKDNLFTGVGHGGYRPIIREKVKKHPELESISKFHTPHNMFLANMVDYGISGMIITLALFFSPLLVFIPNARKNGSTRDFAYAGLILVVAYFFFSMTETIFFRYIFVSPFVIFNAALIALCHTGEIKESIPT